MINRQTAELAGVGIPSMERFQSPYYETQISLSFLNSATGDGHIVLNSMIPPIPATGGYWSQTWFSYAMTSASD